MVNWHVGAKTHITLIATLCALPRNVKIHCACVPPEMELLGVQIVHVARKGIVHLVSEN